MRPGNALLLLLAGCIPLLPLASTAAVPGAGSHPVQRLLPPADPRIVPLCSQTYTPDICISAARPYAHEYPVIDATNLFNILVRALRDRIQVDTAKTLAMTRTQKLDKMVNVSIDSCLRSYEDALEHTGEGIEGFITRDLGTFETTFSMVIGVFSSCNDEFVDIPNPLEAQNNRLMNMAGNCIHIGKMTFKE
ncbi:putative pectinesterase/pectinesterase inhibitor 58 [Cocos nucifera]|uniref:Putative pectinesterase/pectinesterase inhibitor 58 n=1 Tax=Cocos nucifera TaxID=13894 RepID=A0A8K0IA16_COCNU|nr:putative pectinesterase/pectinesterase inhibitor 58 [Cocos nucifera]